MTEIVLANANCSGVLANMTMKQLEKTAVTYGAAKTVLSTSLHHYLTVYSQYIRPQVLCDQQNANELFISRNGSSMTSGQVTKSVQRIWSKAGLCLYIFYFSFILYLHFCAK